MLYAYSVIKGFNSLRGNMFIHIALALTMIICIRVPSVSRSYNSEDPEEIEQYPAANLWYPYAITLHFLIAIF